MKEGDPGDVLLVVLVEASSEGQSSDISELIVLLAVLEAFRSRHRVAFKNQREELSVEFKAAQVSELVSSKDVDCLGDDYIDELALNHDRVNHCLRG